MPTHHLCQIRFGGASLALQWEVRVSSEVLPLKIWPFSDETGAYINKSCEKASQKGMLACVLNRVLLFSWKNDAVNEKNPFMDPVSKHEVLTGILGIRVPVCF